jgi:LysM repeat protein
MKIKQLDEYKYNIVTKGEKGVSDTIHAQASASNKLRQAAANKAKVDNPYAQNASNAPSGASPGSQTTSDASKRNTRTDPTLGDPTDKERAASKAKINAIRGDNKPAAGTKPDVSTATKTKKPRVGAGTTLVATGAAIGLGAAGQKKDSSDTTKSGSATAGDATGDDTVGKSKNSPFYVPPDNASREYKPYPADSRYGKEDAAKAAADAAKATSTQSSSGYKGSKGSQAIQALNPEIADVNKIRTGQELKMPDGSTYTVKQGDALDRIARNAGLSPKTAPSEKPAAPTAKSEPAAPTEPKVYTGAPASVDTRDGTGDLETDKVSYTDKVPDDVAPVVRTGSGGTLTTRDGTPVTSRSANEIEWQMKNPMQTYPGAEAVAKQKEQGEKNWKAIKDFFGGNKEQPKEPETIKVDLDTVDLGTPEGQALRDKVISDIAKTGLAKNNESLDESTLNSIKKLSSITESKITQVDNNMDLRNLLAIMSETKMADLKGKKHGGSYGKEYDTDEEGEDKPAAKKSRGGQESDSTKDSKKWQGADDAADAIIGGKAPKKEVGTKSVKHSIKEWMQTVEQSLLEDEENSFVCVHAKKGKCEVKAKTSYEAAKKAADKWKMKSTAGIDTHRADKPIHVDEEKFTSNGKPVSKFEYDQLQKAAGKQPSPSGVHENLKGGQKKIDKNKNGKLDSEDFKMLRKNKVDEGVNLHKMMTEKHTKVDEMLEELQQEIAEFKTTGEMGDKLRDALDLHTYSKGETLIGEGDQELADKFHDEDMIRLGDEGKADAQHMKDLDRTRDESTADLWRMKDLARDSTMGRADAISLREDDHKAGDTVYHRGQIGIVDRIEGNKCFVHKPNGDMDVWPTEECSKKKQGAFDMFKKDVQDVGAGFGRFLKGKSELDESPFAFEDAEPRLRTTKTDTGTDTTSSTGRIKATFEPGKETKVEPVKEMGPSPLDKTSSSIGSKANPSNASTTAPRERERVVSPKIDKYEKDKANAEQSRRSIVDRESPKANDFGRKVGSAIAEPIAAVKSAWHGATDAWDHAMGNDTAPEPDAPVSVMSRSAANKAGIKESMAYDVWNHQLEKMISESTINESLTVTTTKGDNGTDDSVSVTASGNDASEIMAILRNAGIGSMGNEEEHIDHPTSAYGAPKGESVGIVKIDGPEVIDGDDTMLGLMKKIADISNGNSEHQGHDSSDDYADENCEQEVDEGNAFTGALKDTPQGGEFEVDGKKYTDTSSLEEGNRMCSECGTNMYETDCGHRQMVDEDDVEDAKVGIAAGSPAIQAAEPAAPAQQNTAAPASAGGYAQSATKPDTPDNSNVETDDIQFDPTWGGTKAGPDTRTTMQKILPNALGGKSAPVASNPNAKWDNASQSAVSAIAPANNNSSSYTGAAPAKPADQNVDVKATAQRDQLQKDMNAGNTKLNTNIAPSQINPAVLGKQAGATTKATGKVSYAPNAGGVTKTASANPAQKLAAQNKAGSKIGQGYAQAALAEGPDIEFAEVGLEEDAEYANSDDDAALQDIKFMTNYITGGLNGQKTMHRHGYQNGDNPLAMKESTDPLVQWKKLSGLQ